MGISDSKSQSDPIGRYYKKTKAENHTQSYKRLGSASAVSPVFREDERQCHSDFGFHMSNTDYDRYKGRQNKDGKLKKTIDQHSTTTGCDQLDGAQSSNQILPDSNKQENDLSFKSTGSASVVSPVNQGLQEDERRCHNVMVFDMRRKENNERRKDSKVSVLASTPSELEEDKVHNNRNTDYDQYYGRQNTDGKLQKTIVEHPTNTGCDQLDGAQSSNQILPDSNKQETDLSFESNNDLFTTTKGTERTEKKKKKRKKSKETQHDTCNDTNVTENCPPENGLENISQPKSKKKKNPLQSLKNKSKNKIAFVGNHNPETDSSLPNVEGKNIKESPEKLDNLIKETETEKSKSKMTGLGNHNQVTDSSLPDVDVKVFDEKRDNLRIGSEKGKSLFELHIIEMIRKTKSLEQACGRNLSVLSGKRDEYTCPQEFLQSMNRIEDFLEHLIQENKDNINRLSRLAGDRMTDNNPNIMDLNDPNRPIKLAEQYNQLYDNEWTDAMESLEKIVPRSNDKKEKCAQYLFSLIKAVYTYCKERSKQQLDGLTEQLFLMKNPSVEQVNAMLSQNQTERKKFIESRKHTASIAVTMLQQTLKDDDTFIKENEGCFADLDSKIINELRKSPYFKKCIELCWQFVIQDPPMYLETFSLEGTPINKDTHKLYTQSGYRVKYVVWPALYRHDDTKSSLMAKGVVQPEKQEQIA